MLGSFINRGPNNSSTVLFDADRNCHCHVRKHGKKGWIGCVCVRARKLIGVFLLAGWVPFYFCRDRMVVVYSHGWQHFRTECICVNFPVGDGLFENSNP